MMGLVVAALAVSGGAGITKETVTIDRDKRPYYLYVPDTIGAEPAPLLIALHGSNRDGRSIAEPWRDLASRERFIVAAPDAINHAGWQVPDDGPAFLYFLVEAVKAKHAVDTRRMYLFGHSAGAGFALTMGLMESEFFAGAAIHAGALQKAGRDQLLGAPRKLPIMIVHGTRDATVPVASGREANDTLSSHGFPVEFREMPAHDHNYYVRADAINRQVWDFLQHAVLAEDARYQPYSYSPRR
jgi:polyhydroxybutyrate depolymerase